MTEKSNQAFTFLFTIVFFIVFLFAGVAFFFVVEVEAFERLAFS
jgi:hypothetical protein